MIFNIHSNMDNLTITRATVEDLPTLLRVMDEALDSPTPEQDEAEMPQRVETWKERVNSDKCIILVGRIGDEIVGWARGGVMVERHKIEGIDNSCEVLNLFVRKRYQGKGFGSQLWKSIWEAIVTTYKPDNMIVWSVEKARGFYTKFGGKEIMEKQFDPEYPHSSYAFVWHL